MIRLKSKKAAENSPLWLRVDIWGFDANIRFAPESRQLHPWPDTVATTIDYMLFGWVAAVLVFTEYRQIVPDNGTITRGKRRFVTPTVRWAAL